jgi:GR25 family glycosyltransferase involved in LPS biosynthesis
MRKKTSLLYKIFVGVTTVMIMYLVVCFVFGIKLRPRPYLYEGYKIQKSSKFFKQAYAITLSKYPDRFKKIKESADKAGVPLQAWEGVIVKEEEKDTLPFLGVGTTNYTDRTRRLFNLGVIGAFLAHRNLLEHIRDSNQSDIGTLIFEDDVDIPEDFYDRLSAIENEIPADWDYIFLRKMNVDGNTVSSHVIKLNKDMSGMKNWGFWGFIVKNSSLSNRILPRMEHMLDVPDIQMAKFADKLNMYLVTPPIVDLNEETASKSVVTDIDIKLNK